MAEEHDNQTPQTGDGGDAAGGLTNDALSEIAAKREAARKALEEKLAARRAQAAEDQPAENQQADNQPAEDAGASAQDAVDEMMAQRQAGQGGSMSQDDIDAMLAKRRAAKRADAETAPAAETADQAPAEPADPAEDAGASAQDTVDEMMAQRQAGQGGSMSQDDIDAMLAKRRAAKRAETEAEARVEPEDADEKAAPQLDQDAIDAMMAAKTAGDAPPGEEGDSEVSQAVGIDQDAIDQMIASRQGEAPKLDQSAIDEMLSARKAGDAPSDEAPVDAELEHQAIEKMVAERQQQAEAEPAPAPASVAAEAEEDAGEEEGEVQSAEAIKRRREAALARIRERKSAAAQEETPNSGDSQAPATVVAAGSNRRSLLIQGLMLLNSMAVLGVLVMLLMRTPPQGGPDTASAQPVTPATQPAEKAQPRDILEIPFQVAPGEVASWPAAEKAFADGDYQAAFRQYRSLYAEKGTGPIGEFLLLRLADCLHGLNEREASGRAYRKLTLSGSPIIRATAQARLAAQQLDESNFLAARMHAYRSLAAHGLLKRDTVVAGDARYLVCRATTSELLTFFNPERQMRWAGQVDRDPFASLSESEILELLAEGAGLLSAGTLEPKVTRMPDQAYWQAFCDGAPLEDLLQRYSGEANLEVRWNNVNPAGRRRPVSLGFREVELPTIGEVACGSAGLIGRYMVDRLEVYDPRQYESSQQQRKALATEAILLWRRLLLTAPEDPRLGEAQLALARSYEVGGDSYAALREYRVAADRFRDTRVVTEALVSRAHLQMTMRDFAGARSSLREVLDANPDAEKDIHLSLDLARSTLSAGLVEDASRAYQRLYHQAGSSDARQRACLGVARCLWQQQRYADADVWLQRYLETRGSALDAEAIEAWQMLGVCQMHQQQDDRAVKSFYRALSGRPEADMKARVLLALAETQHNRGREARALAALEAMPAAGVDPAFACKKAIQAARIYRAMGLADRAADGLQKAIAATDSESWRVTLGVELARSFAESGQDIYARELYGDLLGRMAEGPQAWQAACAYAELCLATQKPDRGIAALETLDRSKLPTDLARQASRLLARAYVQKKQLAEAAGLIAAGSVAGEEAKEGQQ